MSHSALNLQGTDRSIEVDALSLPSLLAAVGDPRVDLLKLDIEGAETVVLPAILAASILPEVLCVEFDAWRPVRRLRAIVRQVQDAGYTRERVEGRNVTFVRASAGPLR